jgi:6-pyruvoyltetrahydropterin/6-carboxytetrahydropterin synthase
LKPSLESFGVCVHPGKLHFNAAHFITFNGTCENLHGHNFHVKVDAAGNNTDDAYVIDFVKLDALAAEVCQKLHDCVLLPGLSSEVQILEKAADNSLCIIAYDKRFILPRQSCCILPIPNTTAEMLAKHILDSLLERLTDTEHLSMLQVAVEEADHQWGSCRHQVSHHA